MYPYQISHVLLKTIKEITRQITELNLQLLPEPVFVEFEKQAIVTSSHSSTSIEGNVLPLTEVKRIIKNRPANLRESEREVINYNDTLQSLNERLKQDKVNFDMKLILQIHKGVMNGLLPKGQTGQWRKEPVFVNDPKARKTIYWPPDHQDVPKLLEHLQKFIKENENDLDPLVLAGIFHKQFVIIHPFLDGNGRTVRLATKVLLAKLGINIFNIFSFENYYNKNVSRYFERVGVRGNFYDLQTKVDFTPWLEYFTEGILDEILRVKKQIGNFSVSPKSELNEDQRKILEYIAKKGYIRDEDYAKLTKRAKATRTLDFNKLRGLGMIERHGQGRSIHYKIK